MRLIFNSLLPLPMHHLKKTTQYLSKQFDCSHKERILWIKDTMDKMEWCALVDWTEWFAIITFRRTQPTPTSVSQPAIHYQFPHPPLFIISSPPGLAAATPTPSQELPSPAASISSLRPIRANNYLSRFNQFLFCTDIFFIPPLPPAHVFV